MKTLTPHKLKKPALIASLCALTLIGSAAAFLTSRDLVYNTFSIAAVDLEIEETFDEDQTLSAGQIIQKQPRIKNTGTVSQLFFAEVSVPCMEATFLDSAGQRIAPDGVTPVKAEEYLQTAQIYNLLADATPSRLYITEPVTDGDVTKNWEFSYNAAAADAPGWIYLSQREHQQTYTKVQGMQDGVYDTYLFGYSAWVTPGQATVPLFDRLQLRSIIDAEIADGTLGQVQIRAYTIQADELELSGLTGSGTAASPYTQDDLNRICTVLRNKQTMP